MKGYECALETKPSERQLVWQKTEFYGCINFGMSTFTGRQPEDGFALPASFAPEDVDSDEWAKTACDAGMRGLLVTAKDNDGFCLWQTDTTDYSVKSSSWNDGRGDIVGMVCESCRKFGLKFGINIAVWDKHDPSFKLYGEYNSLFKQQLTELLTKYGELFEIRLDDTMPQYMTFDFDYKGVFELIRELQPNAVISFAGPDVRWVGNNRSFTRKEEWSVIPAFYRRNINGEYPKGNRKIKTNEMQLDLGSRKAVKRETEFVWYPCEVNALMRDHPYYNKDDNYSIKTKDKLHRLYLCTVGSNSALMLSLSPDKRGHIFDTDKQILTSFGRDLKVMFGYNLLKEAQTAASSELSELYKAANVADDDSEKFWRPAEKDKKPELIITFNKKDMFDKVVIGEHIANGQHCEKFKVYISQDSKWQLFGKGTVIGYKAIVAGKPTECDKIKIVFEDYRSFIEISTVIVN